MLQIKNSVVNTVTNAELYDVLVLTSATSCDAKNTISPTFNTCSDEYCVSGDTSAVGTGSQVNLYPTLNGANQIPQSFADTNLVGQGWNGSDIASWAYYDENAGQITAINFNATFSTGVSLSSLFDKIAIIGDKLDIGVDTLSSATKSSLLNEPISQSLSAQSLLNKSIRTQQSLALELALAGVLTSQELELINFSAKLLLGVDAITALSKVINITDGLSVLATYTNALAKQVNLDKVLNLNISQVSTLSKVANINGSVSAALGLSESFTKTLSSLVSFSESLSLGVVLDPTLVKVINIDGQAIAVSIDSNGDVTPLKTLTEQARMTITHTAKISKYVPFNNAFNIGVTLSEDIQKVIHLHSSLDAQLDIIGYTYNESNLVESVVARIDGKIIEISVNATSKDLRIDGQLTTQ